MLRTENPIKMLVGMYEKLVEPLCKDEIFFKNPENYLLKKLEIDLLYDPVTTTLCILWVYP